jgi:amylosucrase
MNKDITIEKQSQITLKRMRPRIEERFASYSTESPEYWEMFLSRLDENFDRLYMLLSSLYGSQFDFYYHLEGLLTTMAKSWIDRPLELKELDEQRDLNPLWFQSNEMLGGICYVDLFSGNLQGLREKIPYFKELGLTYLHLMPLFRMPPGENDGGYAVSNYREVHAPLGKMEDLVRLSSDLRSEGISLVVDFIFNHTASDHEWAKLAQKGDSEYLEYYLTFPDRIMPDAYERNLREIFPDEHSGAFTYSPEMKRWVWTTFHAYQWDLNYANPVVFNRMSEEMLFLANAGVEVLRLDAVAFLWKRIGTSCENLSEAHTLIRAFNTVARIAAPALLFKSEAIVHPDEIIRYIDQHECQLSYNPLIMTLLWESLATRRVDMLKAALEERFPIPNGCAWVNYVRCHDDIGWTFSDEDAFRLGINGFEHRKFLNAFYTGDFPGSFSRGLPFQYNPANQDMRISGTCASLAGLEKAVREETSREVDLAVNRILLIHGVISCLGGIPLLYLGDELGTFNDYAYRSDPNLASDSRWVHRACFDWEKAGRRHDPNQLEGKIFQGMQRIINMRKKTPALRGNELQVISLDNPHILGFVRSFETQRALIFANFSEAVQTVPANTLRIQGLSYDFTNMFTGEGFSLQDLELQPYELVCLAPT